MKKTKPTSPPPFLPPPAPHPQDQYNLKKKKKNIVFTNPQTAQD